MPDYSPLAERAKIREDQRKFENDKALLAIKTYSEQSHALKMNALASVKEYSTSYLRTVFLLNGGAIISLMSFIGSAISRSDRNLFDKAISFANELQLAFMLFTSGVVCGGLASFIAFVNWYAVAALYQQPAEMHEFITNSSTAIRTGKHRFYKRTVIFFGRLCGVAALFFFVAGAIRVAIAFGNFAK